jgi:hypothetical protein
MSGAMSQVSQSDSPKESPTRLDYYIRDLIHDNLFVEDIADNLKCYPYFLLFICRRIATQNNTTMKDIMRGIDDEWASYESFKKFINNKPMCADVRMEEYENCWPAYEKGFQGYTFKGQVKFSKGKTEPLFSLDLHPLQADGSCRFQRAFGADRFLYLNFPSLKKAPIGTSRKFTIEMMNHVQEQWVEWFCTEHSFLGRKWRAFHFEPLKKSKSARRSEVGGFGHRVVLFATSGHGINKPYTILEMLDWFYPFRSQKNWEQTFCKAYARLDLGLSKTIPTAVFKPSQIQYVRDKKANGQPEETEYNDPNLSWHQKVDPLEIMNDGCATMSLGAARMIWKIYMATTGTNEAIPSAFQGRIGGAKGLWIVSTDTYSKDPDHLNVWIKISDSQLKFQPHPEDCPDSYDALRFTFDLCNFSSRPSSSNLHTSYLNIMNDRGVPTDVISRVVTEHLDFERSELLDLLSDPVKIYHWVSKQGPAPRSGEDPRWQAALPHSLSEKITFLLGSGFSQTELPYLAKCLSRFIERRYLFKEQKLCIPLGKSTYLYGVADPLGVLAPGQIHVQFSQPLQDVLTGEKFDNLNDQPVLVARQPACRISDMQKVRAIVHPDLKHLIDIVVFPSVGLIPLASKLQGGDYDGDTFWLCWEPALATPFRNAPAPTSIHHAEYGITKDESRLCDVMKTYDVSGVTSFLRAALAFRSLPDLLGSVSNYHEKLAYRENRVSSSTLNAVCDLHDLLVDAPKQGYSFTTDGFRKFCHQRRIPEHIELPTYRQAMDHCEKAKDMGEGTLARRKDWPFNPKHIVDFLYFEIVRKHNAVTLEEAGQVLATAKDDDSHLKYPCSRLERSLHEDIRKELETLIEGLKRLHRKWNETLNQDLNSEQFNALIDNCYKKFRSFMPIHTEKPEIRPWVEPYLYEDFRLWDTLRASVLYSRFSTRDSFVFHMAGRELGFLKCAPLAGSVQVCSPIMRILRPKMIRAPTRFEEETGDDDIASQISELS